MSLFKQFLSHFICFVPRRPQTRKSTGKSSIQSHQPFRFLDLPPEIRNRIYEYILVPTGYVEIHPMKVKRKTFYHICASNPWFPNTEFGGLTLVCLLFTCKKIYKECGGTFWINNCIMINPWSIHDDYYVTEAMFSGLKRLLKSHSQRLCMKMDELPRYHERILELFKACGRNGNLKFVDISNYEFFNEFHPGQRPFQGVYAEMAAPSVLNDYQQHLSFLRDVSRSLGASIERKRVIFWLDPLSEVKRRSVGEVKRVVHDVHRAFGGELWLNGLECTNDRARVLDSLLRFPRDCNRPQQLPQ